MNTLVKILHAFKAPIPLLDRILEIIALVFLIGTLVFTAYLYQHAPEQVVIKYGLEGEPIKCAEKIVFWLIAIFFGIMMLVSAGSAYDVNLKIVHVRFPIKEQVKAIQHRLVNRMSRCVTICIGLMWLAYLLHTSASFLNIPGYVVALSKGSLLLMLLVIVYYSFRIWHVGRKY